MVPRRKEQTVSRNDGNGLAVIPAAGGDHSIMKNDYRGLEGLGTMSVRCRPDGGSFAVARRPVA